MKLLLLFFWFTSAACSLIKRSERLFEDCPEDEFALICDSAKSDPKGAMDFIFSHLAMFARYPKALDLIKVIPLKKYKRYISKISKNSNINMSDIEFVLGTSKIPKSPEELANVLAMVSSNFESYEGPLLDAIKECILPSVDVETALNLSRLSFRSRKYMLANLRLLFFTKRHERWVLSLRKLVGRFQLSTDDEERLFLLGHFANHPEFGKISSAFLSRDGMTTKMFREELFPNRPRILWPFASGPGPLNGLGRLLSKKIDEEFAILLFEQHPEFCVRRLKYPEICVIGEFYGSELMETIRRIFLFFPKYCQYWMFHAMQKKWKKDATWMKDIIKGQTKLHWDLHYYIPYVNDIGIMTELLDRYQAQYGAEFYLKLSDLQHLVLMGVEEKRLHLILSSNVYLASSKLGYQPRGFDYELRNKGIYSSDIQLCKERKYDTRLIELLKEHKVLIEW